MSSAAALNGALRVICCDSGNPVFDRTDKPHKLLLTILKHMGISINLNLKLMYIGSIYHIRN